MDSDSFVSSAFDWRLWTAGALFVISVSAAALWAAAKRSKMGPPGAGRTKREPDTRNRADAMAQSVSEAARAGGREAPQIKRQSVDSSNVSSVGYDPETQTLEIGFSATKRRRRPDCPDARVYQYSDITPELYEQLMAANSKGKFVWERLVASGAPCERVHSDHDK